MTNRKQDQSTSAAQRVVHGSLSGLELRKAALLALGYRFGDAKDCNAAWPDQWLTQCWWAPDGLPCAEDELAVESDPAVSEPMFLEWCTARGWSFELFGPVRHPLKPRLEGMYGCKVARWDGHFYDPFVEVYAESPSEARARAIGAASNTQKEPSTAPAAQKLKDPEVQS